MKIKSKMENIFKKGDRVYNSTSGWCVVIEPDTNRSNSFGMCSFVRIERTGEEDCVPNIELSFTEYKIKGLSHKRPIDYKSWEGKYCMFWDDKDSRYIIDRFKEYKIKGTHPFGSEYCNAWWKNCKLLSEVTLKELGLTNG